MLPLRIGQHLLVRAVPQPDVPQYFVPDGVSV